MGRLLFRLLGLTLPTQIFHSALSSDSSYLIIHLKPYKLMKKMYLFLAAFVVAAFTAVTPAQADDVTFEVSGSTGFWTDWNNNPGNSWAKTWESTQEDPHITIHQASNANNMRFWDGTHIMFYNSVGGRTDAENYDITVSSGWNITGVSFDFTCGEVTGVVGNKSAGVSISLYGEAAVENWSSEDFEHVEVTGIEDSKVTFTVATLTPGSATFANTKNFIITLAQKGGIDVAWEKFREILGRYDTYVEEQFPVGSAPGLYDEAARKAFFDAIAAGYDSENIPEEDVTEELLAKLGQDIVDAYDALVASKNMNYVLPEGTIFFRIKSALTYHNDVPTGEKDVDGFPVTENVELPKYMLCVQSGDKFYGYWATPEENNALDQLQALWTIVKTDDGYDVINMYNECRFNNVARSTSVAMSPESENLLAFDPAYTDEEGVTYLNIRVATQNGADGLYLHQNGHGGGTGVQNYLVGWYSTFDYQAGPGASEWVIEPVSPGQAQDILTAGAAAKERERFEKDYAELIKTANLDLAGAQVDVEATPLITSADQLSSPWSDADEGQDLGALIDDDPSTYWHSDWHSGNQPAHTHYLQAALTEPAHNLVRISVTRRPVSNDHITLWSVYGSNNAEAEDENWVPLAKLYTPFGNNTETVITRAFDAKGYTNLRFYFDGTTSNRGYGHMSEFQLQAITIVPGSQYAGLAAQAEKLTGVIASQEFTAISDITEAQGAELEAAYNALKGEYVDPTELRNLIASAEQLAAGILVGTDPGYWADNTLAEALAKVVADAKAYDEGQVYTAAESAAFIEAINTATEPILAAANGIKEGKWYTIHFGSEADFEKYGWDLVAGEAIYSQAEEGQEGELIDEPLWDKFLTVAVASDEAIDEESGLYKHVIEPIALEDVRPGARLFVDDESDIEDADMAKFRFVRVDEDAYLLQNKATGLFLRAAGTSGAVSLNVIPSLFSVKAIGFGQNLIAATDLKGNSQNYLHVQRDYNTLVTWNATEPGSRSALYLHESEDVAADYSGEQFAWNIRPGQIYTFCYPVNLALGKDNGGTMYTVNKVEDKSVTLAVIEGGASAGRPFIYIDGEAEDYHAEDEAEPVYFLHGYDIAAEPDTAHVLKGTYVQVTPGKGNIMVNENKRNEFTVTRPMMENSTIGAYQAYIAPEVKLNVGDEIELVISTEGDAVQSVLANVSRSGAIYTIDGRLVAKKGNLNTLRTLGRGTYIVNGTKVIVK